MVWQPKFILTDDGVDKIIVDLAELLEELGLNMDDDEIYEKISEKMRTLLDDYSNGYRNYN